MGQLWVQDDTGGYVDLSVACALDVGTVGDRVHAYAVFDRPGARGADDSTTVYLGDGFQFTPGEIGVHNEELATAYQRARGQLAYYVRLLNDGHEIRA
jgi:hypothetical protein